MKKSRIWILPILIICCLTGMIIRLNAATNVTIYSDNIEAQYLSTVEVPISIQNNTGMMGFGFEISYDSEYLEPLSVENENIINEGTFDDSIGTKYTNPFRVVWAGTNEIYSTGKLFTLKFTSKKSGMTEIQINAMKNDTYDGQYNKIAIDSLNIKINIVCSHQYQEQIEKMPTCTKEGMKKYTCSICGDTYEEYMERTEHNYNITTTEATCTKSGVKEYQCNDCSYHYSEILEAKGHSYENVVTEPTCTSKGYTTYTCRVCQHSYVSDYQDMIAHQYTSQITKPATCTAEGIETYTCIECGRSYEEKIDKKEHDYKVETTEVTCTKDGEKVYTCKDCNYSYTEIVAASGHTYEQTITKPTCTAQGYTTYRCSKCANTYTDNYTEALGHQIVIDEYKSPTCTQAGLTQGSHCSVCETVIAKQQEIPMLHHVYEKEIVKASCTEDGYTEYTCKYCQDTYKEDIVEALGHDYISFVTKPATDKEPGVETHQCRNCGDTYTTEIPLITSSTGDKSKDNLTMDSTVNVTKERPTTDRFVNPSNQESSTISGTIKTSKIKKIKKNKRSLKITWKKVNEITGYQIQYSTSKKFKKAKKITVKKVKTTSKTIKRLKSKKKYYVRIRTYVLINGEKKYSDWSKAKSAKVR